MNENSGQPEAIAFADFLEGVPPSQTKLIAGLFEPERHFFNLVTPQLLLHCTSEMCNGPRAHRRVGDAPSIFKPEPTKNVFLSFICSNCRAKHKVFALHVSLIDEGPTGTAYKFGELPPFGPITPTRLLKLLGDQREFFLKGRRCENQGLGIGAFG